MAPPRKSKKAQKAQQAQKAQKAQQAEKAPKPSKANDVNEADPIAEPHGTPSKRRKTSHGDDDDDDESPEKQDIKMSDPAAPEEVVPEKEDVKMSDPAAPAERPPSSEPESATVDHEPATGDQQAPAPPQTFEELGVITELREACQRLGYTKPTPIQAEAIPWALTGRDIIGIAETGSGKTAAFALPIIQSLLLSKTPSPLYALVLAPTRELAVQIQEQFNALGSIIDLRTTLVVGGMERIQQSIALTKKPHVIVATPGRILDHLDSTKGFSLNKLKYLVLDEADRLIDQDFMAVIEKILKHLPRERKTFLFSATLSSKVESLQRASLRDPVRVSVSSSKYATVDGLRQSYLFIPHMHKDTYLVSLCNDFTGKTIIIFTRTVLETQRVALLLRQLGMSAIPLHGSLAQSERLGALNKFRAGSRSILVATDVAARGLDIPNVDCVINFDLPQDSKTYVHRVGRTARAGKSGNAVSIVTQYDIEIYKRIEKALKKQLDEYPTIKDEVMVFKMRTEQAQREAKMQLKSMVDDRGKKGSLLKGSHRKRSHPGSARDHMDQEEG